MKVEYSDNVLKLSGVLDERTDMSSLVSLLDQAQRGGKDDCLVFDFLEVKRANSVGIIKWSDFVKKVQCRIVYENAPQWLVEQFNFRSVVLKNGASVASLLAPFFCPSDQTYEMLRLEVGKDIPLLSDYSTFVIERTSKNGYRLEPDFDPEEYLSFLLKK